MADFEIIEKVPEVSKATTLEQFNEITKGFSEELKSKFKFDSETNKVKIKNFNGDFIDIEQISSEFDGLKEGKVPDLTKVFKELGVPESEFTEQIKAKIAEAENAFKKKYEPIAQVNATQNANTIPDPTGPNDVKPSVAQQIIESVKKNLGQVGKWVATTIATNGLTIFTVFEVVQAHRQQCNGCWKFSLTNPNDKCKILEFTCDQGAHISTDQNYAKPCSACTNTYASGCALAFNPCVRKSNTDDFYINNSTGPGDGGENCLIPKVVETDTEGCADKPMCSKNCSCEYSDNCIGYGFQCVDLSWGQAATDLARIPLNNLGALGNQGVDLISLIIKILKIVAIVCGVLFIIFIIFMIIKQVSSKSSQQQAPPVAQLSSAYPTYPSYPTYPTYPQPSITPNSV
jgi:hypothetical protein